MGVGTFATTRDGQVGPETRPVAIPDDVGSLGAQRLRGIVKLPLRVRWSDPRRSYDLANRQDRILVYEQVLAEGTEDDVRQFVDVDELAELWSDLVLPRHVRRAWTAWLRQRDMV